MKSGVAELLKEVRRRWCAGGEAEAEFGRSFVALRTFPTPSPACELNTLDRQLKDIGIDEQTAAEMVDFLRSIAMGAI